MAGGSRARGYVRTICGRRRQNLPLRWSFALLALFVVSLCRAESDWSALPAGARERLRAGDVVLEEHAEEMRHADVRASILVHAPVERVWAVITSCDLAYAFVAGLRYCEVLEERGDYALTRQVVDKGWTTPRLDYTFETRREPYRRMAFELVDGNLEALHGSWTFDRTAHGILVRHELVLDPLVPAPRWLVRRNIVHDLPDMMRCIRALADGSGSPELAEADRGACPGEPGSGPQAAGFRGAGDGGDPVSP